MIEYIYFVKCPNCEDEHFDFFDEAKAFAMGCLSKKPIITQTEVNRNDFGECTDSSDLGTIWSWEDECKECGPDADKAGSHILTKADLENVPERDPEFDDDDFFAVNTLEENAVVDCKVADVITHSEDEKPIDCKGEKKPLEKPLTENLATGIDFRSPAEFNEFKKLCDEIGLKTLGDLELFARNEGVTESNTLLDKLREYRAELGPDFKIKESIEEAAKLKTWTCFYEGRDIGTVRAATKEEAEEQMMIQYPDRSYNNTDWGVELLNPSTEACERKPVPEGMTIEQLVEEMEENEDEVECTWCNDLYTKDMCRKEINLGWLCPRCEAAIKSRGETLTFKENNYWDFLDEKFDIDFEDEASSDMLDATSDVAAAEEEITEAIDPKETVNLEYSNLTVTVYGPMRDVDDWDEADYTGSYTLEVRKDDVANYALWDLLTEQDVADVPGGLEALEDNDLWEEFIDANFDRLFEKYYDKILEIYKEAAEEEFANTVSWSDYKDQFDTSDDDYDRYRDELWD